MGLALAWGEFTTEQGMTVLLREARFDDLELLMAWRSNPWVFEGTYTQKRPLTWAEHLQWWKSRNQDWKIFLIIFESRKVGVVTIGQLDYWEPEIGLYTGEVSLWGRGIGKESLKLAIEWIRSKGYKYTRTTIKDDNVRSIRLFLGLGYVVVGKARPGESLYRLVL